MGKTEDFLRKHMLSAASVDTDKTLAFILSEMKKGLDKENSSSCQGLLSLSLMQAERISVHAL